MRITELYTMTIIGYRLLYVLFTHTILHDDDTYSYYTILYYTVLYYTIYNSSDSLYTEKRQLPICSVAVFRGIIIIIILSCLEVLLLLYYRIIIIITYYNILHRNWEPLLKSAKVRQLRDIWRK